MYAISSGISLNGADRLSLELGSLSCIDPPPLNMGGMLAHSPVTAYLWVLYALSCAAALPLLHVFKYPLRNSIGSISRCSFEPCLGRFWGLFLGFFVVPSCSARSFLVLFTPHALHSVLAPYGPSRHWGVRVDPHLVQHLVPSRKPEAKGNSVRSNAQHVFFRCSHSSCSSAYIFLRREPAEARFGWVDVMLRFRCWTSTS
mmetsp:Transcript_12626/g.36148  ORF Transcript_12626/g.36148 Transcript_12626/m.36148 type:complete len:201 (+) Transcript_12626:822-1424(+)